MVDHADAALRAGRLAAAGADGVLTGSCLVLYSWGSNFVMPAYVDASASQFGALGLILAITTWLVGAAGILVVAAVVGRVLVEDEDIGRLVQRFGRRTGCCGAAVTRVPG